MLARAPVAPEVGAVARLAAVADGDDVGAAGATGDGEPTAAEGLNVVSDSVSEPYAANGAVARWFGDGGRIRIVSEAERGGVPSEFNEPWVQGLGHDRARPQVFTIYYGNSFVRYVHTVAVDGYRAYIPYPKSATELVISDWQYRFAQIIQPPYDRLDSYLEHAGIRVE